MSRPERQEGRSTQPSDATPDDLEWERRYHATAADLRAAKAVLRQTQQELHRAQRDLAALRHRRAVRLAVGVADRARRVRGLVRRFALGQNPAAPAAVATKRLRASLGEAKAFERRLSDVLLPSARTAGPQVSAVVVIDDAGESEQRMSGIDAQAYNDLDVVVVDPRPADEPRPAMDAAARHRIIVVRPEHEHEGSLATLLDFGARQSTGDFVLFLSGGATPAGPHVLGHMVQRMIDDPNVVAVTGRSILPRRAGPHMGPESEPADLTLLHRGLTFATCHHASIVRAIGVGENPFADAADLPRDVPAAPTSHLLVRRTALDAIGGLDARFKTDALAIDMSLRLREAGGGIVYEPQAVFWAHGPVQRSVGAGDPAGISVTSDLQRLRDHWGPRLTREVLLDRLSGARAWSDLPLRVAITLTKDDPSAGYGDWHTAHELGDALAAVGWQVTYLERWHEGWYDVDPDTDVIVSLIDTLDLRRLPPGIVTVAWVRNWTDRWLEQPWFDEYDLVLASSVRSKELIDAGSVHVASVMPIATNPDRFRPRDVDPAEAQDVVFTGSSWGQPRAIEDALPALVERGWRVAVYGRGWEDVPAIAPLARGSRPYDELGAVYSGASIVLDDAAGPVRPYGSVNSRVFDALAAGTLVVSDNVIGMRELFGPATPAVDSSDEMVDVVERYLRDPSAREREVERLRSIVLAEHTYAQRARQLRDLLVDWVSSRHVDIAIGVPNWDLAESWGDYHFARALQRVLQRRRIPTRVRLLPDWEHPASASADVALHLFGLSVRRPRAGQLSCLWIISHPEKVIDELLDGQDHVFAAGDPFAERLAARTGRPVVPLHQATDPERFRPGPGPKHELLFIGNSRGVRRRIVDALAGTSYDLAVYGSNWTPELLDPRYLRGDHVPNVQLPGYYANATIVLNDHWPDMAAQGFLSNRLYDAAASGAFVISDEAVGLDAEFDGGIPTFTDAEGLHALIDRYLADGELRAAQAARARAAVLTRHTVADRVDVLLDVIEPALAGRPATIVTRPATPDTMVG